MELEKEGQAACPSFSAGCLVRRGLCLEKEAETDGLENYSPLVNGTISTLISAEIW